MAQSASVGLHAAESFDSSTLSDHDVRLKHKPSKRNLKASEENLLAFEKDYRMTTNPNEYPDKSIEFVRCIAEGDLVALHTHQTWPGNDEYVTMDFLRFDENGKIVEHWDAIQQIPEKAAHDNGMY